MDFLGSDSTALLCASTNLLWEGRGEVEPVLIERESVCVVAGGGGAASSGLFLSQFVIMVVAGGWG